MRSTDPRATSSDRLEEDPAALATALDASGIGIFEYDLVTREQRFSDRCRAIWGLSAGDDVSSQRIEALVHAEDRPAVTRLLQSLRSDAPDPDSPVPRSFAAEHRIIRPDGAVRWLRVQGRTVFDPGRSPRTIGTVQDITDQRVQLAESEALFRAAFEQAAVGVAHVALDGHWLRVNQALCSLLGYTQAELLQTTFQDVTHPEDLQPDLDHVKALLDGQLPSYTIEKRYIRRDGSPIWARLTVSLLRDEAGTPRYFISIVQDISAHIAAKHALAENEARLRVAIEGAGVGTFEIDLERHRVHFSPESARLHGLPEDHPLAFDQALWERMVHPEDAAAGSEGMVRAIRDRTFYDYTFRVLLPHGERRWIQGLGRAHYAADGRPLRFIGLNFDVTARKQVEDALRHAVAGLREADVRKDEFLATLSHELRNPLAPIRNAAEILGAANLTAESLAWARQVIQRQVQQMAWLLDDLLDVARITQGKLELKVDRVPLTSIVDAAVEAARPLIDRKHHELAVVMPAEPLVLEGDPLRLSQVLSNLLTNAAKYTDPRGRIELAGRVESDTLCFTVRDNGIGIPGEAVEQIFTMFSQVEASRSRSEGGLGIGLALVRGILALHGGSIEAHSAGLGRGSEFTLRLPLPAAARAVAPAAPPAARQTGGPRRVLVADDNEDAADSLALLLNLSGHDVRVAHSGRAALALARDYHPEVCILDLGMPELDGYALARQLRQEAWGSDLCLIALTGWGQEEDKRHAREAGFDHHLTKPVDPDSLDTLIRRRPAG